MVGPTATDNSYKLGGAPTPLCLRTLKLQLPVRKQHSSFDLPPNYSDCSGVLSWRVGWIWPRARLPTPCSERHQNEQAQCPRPGGERSHQPATSIGHASEKSRLHEPPPGGSVREVSHRTMKMGRDVYQALKEMPLEGEGREGKGKARGGVLGRGP